ncbi:MAG TPA: hypothetical protein VGK18_01825 [Propionicimonas sp.]|uniref:hypothetical protein n=1 Tax=Propionicimonas sp. TaxID=1955623 RepID=UPI002F42EFF9
MGSIQERAAEVVILAAPFRQGRDVIVRDFPPSVLDLYDAVVARPDWVTARNLTQLALVVARVLDANPALEARYQADVDAGLLGFGPARMMNWSAARASATLGQVPADSGNTPS